MNHKGKKLLSGIGIFILAAFTVISCSLTAVINGKAPAETTVHAEESIDYPALGNDWYKDWDYTLLGNQIIIMKYNGNETNYRVPSVAYVDGEKYLTTINAYTFKTGKIINISFEKGFKFPQHSESLFANNTQIKSIDLSNTDTTNTVYMSGMFDNCKSLISLNLNGIDTSNVTDMSYMFLNCIALQSLDLSSLNTHNVTNFAGMFCNCPSLKELDLKKFDTASITNMSFMFGGCQSLQSLNLSNFNTANVTNMSNMFKGCESLSSLNLKNFDTSNVIEMEGMFDSCSSLNNLNISSFNTKNVVDINRMFLGCTSIQSLDLSSFDLSNVSNLFGMLSILPTMRTIVIGNNFKFKDNAGNDAGLMGIMDNQYSGKWTLNDENNHKDAITAKQLMATYDGKTMSGKWVAEKRESVVTMYRAYNPNSGEHFYTSNTKEFNHIVSLGWKNEGVGWIAPQSSKTPVYRLYNANGGEHHYTSNAKEKNALIKAGWKDEGIGWYSDDSKKTPLYRQYNPNAFANNHNYTTSKKENDTLVKLGWRYEGIGWYGVRAQ